MTKQQIKKHLEEFRQTLPELERRLTRHIREASAVAVRRRSTPDGAQLAADPRRNYSRGRK